MTTTQTSNRLANIATRQRTTRARDLVFAAFVVLATVIGVSGVQSASSAANAHHIAQR